MNCTVPRCGNGIVDTGEECDDGNTVNGDTCDNNCTPPRCGNGIVDPNEQCDDGNAVNGDGCDSNCTKPACGNGIKTGAELCDDGNATNGDGCDVNCSVTGCGNGIVTLGEECDDANHVDGDGCEADCTLPRCGNGILDANEQCDDGNNVNGDGCSATCERQEICDDLEDNDADGLVDCDDPDCNDCGQIFKDPAIITFRTPDPDSLTVHGSIAPIAFHDPRNERFGVAITSPDGVVYKAFLQPGDLVGRTDKKMSFVDKQARGGNGTRGGIAKVLIRRRGDRFWFSVEAYGDFSRATQEVMTAQLIVGKEAFAFKSEWQRIKKGWKTDFKFPFD